MGWTERQRDMLAAMGLRLWSPPQDAADAVGPLLQAGDAAGAPEADAPQAAAPAPAAQSSPVVPAAQARSSPPRPVAAARPADPPFASNASPPAPSVAEPGVQSSPAEPGEDRTQTIARLDWDGLRQAVAGCRACSLCESRQQTVFGVGHVQADWMIVGEAPGEQEDAQGEPFVGPAGQLLDRMLAALGLSRTEGGPQQQVFIANTLKCRPPRNRNPAPEEMARCAPFLSRQIALVQPRLILAMGRFAIQHLLGTDEAVGKLRGRVHRHAGVPVVVTYHPAYLLRQPADKRKAWDDLCLAAEVAEGRPADPPG